MCASGSKRKKPMSFLQVPEFLNGLARACPGLSSSHVHEELSGKVQTPEGKWVYKTKLAQVYPKTLCDRYAELCGSLKSAARYAAHVRLALDATDPLCLELSDLDGQQFQQLFHLCTPAADRKRPVGSQCKWLERRQASSGRKAVSSGYQMKRGVVAPTFLQEPEPGQATPMALDVVHPFTKGSARGCLAPEHPADLH